MFFKPCLRALAGAALLAAAAQPTFAQQGFQCPIKPLDEAGAASVRAVLPTGDAYDDPKALVSAVAALHHEGIGAPAVIDTLIAAYCPTVAGEAGLTDAQKTQKVASFASRITRTVYGLDSEDAVILDVSFPPAAMDLIGEKAKAAGLQPEDWVRQTVEAALN